MFTSGEIEAVRLVGPMAPATKRGLSGVFLRPGIGRLARELGRGDVHLIGDVLQPVIGLADGLRVEGVGLEDVGARFEIGAVDLADDLGLGQHQEVVVALEIVVRSLKRSPR